MKLGKHFVDYQGRLSIEKIVPSCSQITEDDSSKPAAPSAADGEDEKMDTAGQDGEKADEEDGRSRKRRDRKNRWGPCDPQEEETPDKRRKTSESEENQDDKQRERSRDRDSRDRGEGRSSRAKERCVWNRIYHDLSILTGQNGILLLQSIDTLKLVNFFTYFLEITLFSLLGCLLL